MHALVFLPFFYNTDKHNLCHMKTGCAAYVFFHSEFKYVIKISLLPTIFA